MTLWLIPLDYSLPAVRARLAALGEDLLDPAEAEAAARLLERCIRTGEALTTFALHVAGRPSLQ